jgi:hypothetical protein
LLGIVFDCHCSNITFADRAVKKPQQKIAEPQYHAPPTSPRMPIEDANVTDRTRCLMVKRLTKRKTKEIV